MALDAFWQRFLKSMSHAVNLYNKVGIARQQDAIGIPSRIAPLKRGFHS
jgi:hypothetical protein